MIFNSNFSEDEIYEDIIRELPDKCLELVVRNNVILRAKYGALEQKKFRFKREKAESIILNNFRNNKLIKEGIITAWEIETKGLAKDINKYKTIKELREYENQRRLTLKTVLFCSLLWAADDINKSNLADDIYKSYKERKEVESEDEELELDEFIKGNEELEVGEVCSMENYKKDVMSMNLGECIEALCKYKERIEFLENELINKNKSIEGLEQKISTNDDNKDLKKEMKSMSKSLTEVLSVINKENTSLKDELKVIKNQNVELNKELLKQFKVIDKLQKNSNTKELKDIITQSQNSVKGALIEDNKKIIWEIKKYINEEVMSEIKNPEMQIQEVNTEFENSIKNIGANIKEKNEPKEIKANTADNDILTQPLFYEGEFDDIFNN